MMNMMNNKTLLFFIMFIMFILSKFLFSRPAPELRMRRIAAVALTAFAGVASAQSSSAGWPPQPAAGYQVASLNDPYMGMTAYAVEFPKGWHFRGAVYQGTLCFPAANAVWRVVSPDGLSFIEKLPPLAWAWGGRDAGRVKPGCIPLDDGMSAKDFLKALSAEMKLDYVGEVQIADSVLKAFQRARAQQDEMWANKYRAAGMTPPENFHDIAAADVRFTNGSYKMHGRLRTEVSCSRQWGTNSYGERVWHASCNAQVRYMAAPVASFDAILALVPNTSALANPQWDLAVAQREDQRTAMMLQMINARAKAETQAMTAQYEAFNQQQEATQRQHEQFLATLQQGTDASMRNAAAIANAQHTMTSDFVDGILGQQTVRDPATGESAKVPSGFNYTWHNAGTNEYFQTADPNVNPNGALTGNWTVSTKIHGDGTP